MAARANFGIGIPIALFFLIGGIAFWIVIPDVLIGQIWVGVSLLLLLIFGALARAGAKAARIRLEGIQGTATLLDEGAITQEEHDNKRKEILAEL